MGWRQPAHLTTPMSQPFQMRAATPFLVLDGLCLRFPHCELFSQLSAEVPHGVTLVRGGESSGKTSLLRIVAGELSANAGSVRVNGTDVQANPDTWRQMVFWVSPRTDAYDAISAADFFERMRRVHSHFDDRLLQDLVDSLTIAPHLDKPLYMLSTGSRRKVWLAAAFASGAPITLLDEPFAALDSQSIACVKQQLALADSQHMRVFLLADYEAPVGVPLVGVIDLGD